MKNLHQLNLTIIEKIAFVEFCEDRENDCESHMDTYQHNDDSMEENIRYAIRQESISERAERKQESEQYHYDEISMNRRMQDVYADECTLNGR